METNYKNLESRRYWESTKNTENWRNGRNNKRDVKICNSDSRILEINGWGKEELIRRGIRYFVMERKNKQIMGRLLDI